MTIRACIFDLGGTIIDKYSLTPLISMQKAFMNKGIQVDPSLIRKDMGMSKVEHIDYLCKYPIIQKQWYENYGSLINEIQKQHLLNDYLSIQKKETIENMNVIPQTYNIIKKLKEMNIKTGVTTGFDKEQTDRVKGILESKNIYLDNYVSSSCLNKPGRPYPYMIYENMVKLNITDPSEVIKIDDTYSGIKEGLNANCMTVSVSRWSINMNIDSYEEMVQFEKGLMKNSNYSDNYYNLFKKLNDSKKLLEKSGAHYNIRNLNELINIIQNLNS